MKIINCKLIYNALTDPTWNCDLNIKLCNFDNCEECPYWIKKGKEVD